MKTEKMEFPRQLLLLIMHLLCFGHLGVYGRSTFEANPLDSTPSSPASSQSPHLETNLSESVPSSFASSQSSQSETNPLDNVPSSSASSQSTNFETNPSESVPSSSASPQSPYVVPISPRTTYPRTPARSSATTVPSAVPSSFPFEVSSAVFSSFPFFSSPQSPVYTPVKTTPPRGLQPGPASETTLPLALRTSALPSSVQPTLAKTSIPVNSPPSSVSQRCQLTFTNKYDDLRGTDYDLWAHRPNAQRQVADFCGGITTDRITNVAIERSPSGNLVLRFSIEQGWPVYTADALQNLKNRLRTSNLTLANNPLTSPVSVYWTDNGPCPNETCLNNGICDVTLASEYKCSCDDGYTGVRCQDVVRAMPISAASPNNALFALLVLLVIPIAIAVVVGFIFGRRKQQKQQLKKAFDLRDVRTIGPRSMLSLPMEPGIRNDMYDTRSFALAFSDTTFSKTVPSTTNEEIASNAEF